VGLQRLRENGAHQFFGEVPESPGETQHWESVKVLNRMRVQTLENWT